MAENATKVINLARQDPYTNTRDELSSDSSLYATPPHLWTHCAKRKSVWNARNGGQGTQYRSLTGETMNTSNWKKQQPFLVQKVTPTQH